MVKARCVITKKLSIIVSDVTRKILNALEMTIQKLIE